MGHRRYGHQAMKPARGCFSVVGFDAVCVMSDMAFVIAAAILAVQALVALGCAELVLTVGTLKHEQSY